MTRIAYAASMHEETVVGFHVLHILVTEPFEIGKIIRQSGDAYCKPSCKFYDLWDEGEGTPTCPHCIRIAERLQKKQEGTAMAEIRWRKQGDTDWTPSHVHLAGDDNNELALIELKGNGRFACASCGKVLRDVMYVLYGPVPRRVITDQRYCIEHSPIPVEIQEQ
jgi:hypothetical protein